MKFTFNFYLSTEADKISTQCIYFSNTVMFTAITAKYFNVFIYEYNLEYVKGVESYLLFRAINLF